METFREAQIAMGGVECGTFEDKAKYLGKPPPPPIFLSYLIPLPLFPPTRSRQADSLR